MKLKLLSTLLLLTLVATALAAPPPIITSSTFDGTFCTVSWTHPTAKKFQIGISAEGSSRCEYPPVTAGTNFTWTFPPRETVFEVAVRGMSSNPAFTNVTEWSNRVGHNKAPPSGPPIPWDGRTTVVSASLPGSTFALSGFSTNILMLTWGYTGPVTPNHEFRVHQSGDLRTWTVIASIPTRVTQGFQVPPLPRGFYKVSSVESGSPDVHIWTTITNLVMDP